MPRIRQKPAFDRVHWLIRIYGAIVGIFGLGLLLGGIYLITLGGSWYYALAGAGLVASGLALWKGRIGGLWIYLLVFAATIAWALWEVGLTFWPLVPRLIAPLFMAALGLMLVPFFRPSGGRPDRARGFVLAGLACMVAFAAYLAAMFQPHDVIFNADIALTEGQIDQATLDAGNNWPAWGRIGGGNRYAPFDQITPDNIDGLTVAWTARTGFIADQGQHEQDQHTPIYVDGTLYHCAPVGQITALDGVTGKIKWQFDPKAESTDWKRCRSLSYFDPGPGDACGPRIIETTVDARLIAVRASDGKPCDSFGEGGTVSLWQGMGDTEAEYLTNSSGAVVVNGKIVLGGRVTDNVTVGEPSGVIRAYDAVSGEMAWVWDMGQPELKGLPPEGQHYTKGTPNAWAPLSYDADLGMVYVPLGNATPDIYGGLRRDFDDKYSSSVVALDVETGDVQWFFQTARHDLWDYDIPSQPVLADIPDGNGGAVPGVIVTTKRAQTFVLDRRTGAPLKAVEDRPAPKSDGSIEGEYYAETQPYSVEMAAIGAEPLTEAKMWGATPFDQLLCRIQFHKYRYDGEFTTPGLDTSIIYPGALGGMNYGSAAIDPASNIMVAVEMRMPLLQHLLPRADVTSDMVYTGESGPFQPMSGTPYAMERGAFMSPLMIPCLQPPWGTVSAIDLASGRQIWQQPAGTAKDLSINGVRPGLPFYIGLPPLGGSMVTGGGIAWFAGFQDFYMRAYDVKTGTPLWQGRLPTGTQATPMSYIGADGRQYVVISASGGRYNPSNWGDYIIAYALPK